MQRHPDRLNFLAASLMLRGKSLRILAAIACLFFSVFTLAQQVRPNFSLQFERDVIHKFLTQSQSDAIRGQHLASRPGALRETHVVLRYDPQQDLRVAEVILSEKGWQMAYVAARPLGPGYQIRTFVNIGNKTDSTSFQLSDVLTHEFQQFRLEEWQGVQRELAKEAFQEAGSDLLGLLFYVWKGIKDFQQVEHQFEQTLQQYEEVRTLFERSNPTDLLILMKLDQMAHQTTEVFARERFKSGAAVAWWLGLDILTYVPKLGIKATQGVFLPLARWIGHSRFGALAGRYGEQAVARVSDGVDWVKRPLSKVGIRLGLFAAVGRARLATHHLSEMVGKLRAAQALGRYWRTSPKLQGFVAVDRYLNCNVHENPARYRSWILSMFYAIPTSISAQALERQTQFWAEFDEVLHDLVISFANSLTIGRCFSHFDRPEPRNMWERWYERQFMSHLSNYMDTSLTTAKLLADSEGLTEEDLEYLRQRTMANFAYTLTRGPLVGTWSSINRADLNTTYFDLLSAASQDRIHQHLTTEFFSRYFMGMTSWYAYLAFREGNSREDLAAMEKANLEALTRDLETTIQSLRSGEGRPPNPFELPFERPL